MFVYLFIYFFLKMIEGFVNVRVVALHLPMTNHLREWNEDCEVLQREK